MGAHRCHAYLLTCQACAPVHPVASAAWDARVGAGATEARGADVETARTHLVRGVSGTAGLSAASTKSMTLDAAKNRDPIKRLVE